MREGRGRVSCGGEGDGLYFHEMNVNCFSMEYFPPKEIECF